MVWMCEMKATAGMLEIIIVAAEEDLLSLLKLCDVFWKQRQSFFI